MSSTLACLLTMNVENRIAASVLKGSVALDLLKPVNIFGIYLWEDIGSVAIAFLQNAVPLLLIGALFIVAPVPASAAHFLLFILSAAFSYMINWLIAALFGMWSFRIVRIFPLLCMKGHMIRLLSGSVIPLWFFRNGCKRMDVFSNCFFIWSCHALPRLFHYPVYPDLAYWGHYAGRRA